MLIEYFNIQSKQRADVNLDQAKQLFNLFLFTIIFQALVKLLNYKSKTFL